MKAEDNYQGGENVGKGRGSAMCWVSGIFLSEEEEIRGGVSGEEPRQGEFIEDKGKDFLNEESSQQISLTERFRKRVSYEQLGGHSMIIFKSVGNGLLEWIKEGQKL